MNLSRFLRKFAVLSTIAVSMSVYAGNVSTDGSTSMEKVIGMLSEAYHNAHNDVNITYNPTGSGSGISSAQEGRCDIGLSSRALKADEKKVLNDIVVAFDGIAMVVNPNNKVDGLSAEQVADIFVGKITNWKEVGGSDRPIVLIGREAGSGTRDGFESATSTKEKCQYRQELTSTGDVITTVSTNENAIGYASVSSVSKKVKTLKINGVEATESAIKDGSYKLQRPFVMVTKKDSKLSKDVIDFLDFATSKEASPLLIKAGVVPAAK